MGSRRTEITIETHSVTIIKGSDLADCVECGGRVPTFSLTNASLVFGTEREELHRASLDGRVHTAADLRLCGRSIAEFLERDVRYIED